MQNHIFRRLGTGKGDKGFINISIVRRPDGEVVYVINNDKAEARSIETGVYDSGRVEIISGLNGNETVATDGAAFLTDGASVKLAEPIN